MALPTSKIVPKASALFLPYEIDLYQRWRKSTFDIATENDDDVHLPTAFEYMDFLEWRARQCAKLDGTPEAERKSPDPAFAGYILAEQCGHPLHPGDPRPDALRQPKDEVEEKGEERDTVVLCSMCLLQIHLKLLAELWDKWLDSGGPWRVLRPGSTAKGFQISKRAYYMRKTNLVNDVDTLEEIARLEDAWDAAHPTADVEVVRAYSAKTTVDVYAKGVQFPARLAEPDAIAPRTPAGKERKKRLSYSPDTPEDTRHRSSAVFARRCLAYDPESPHRCPGDDGWAETSFKNSWEYNVRQCRTLLCNKEPNQPDVTYRELADEASKDNLINGIEEWLGKMQDDWTQPWVDILLTTTEMFLVWQDPCDEDGRDTDFNNWDRTETLVGTNLEAYARQIGDLNEEDDADAVEGETAENFFDQDSVASDSDSDEEDDELPDPMDLEEDEDVAISTDE